MKAIIQGVIIIKQRWLSSLRLVQVYTCAAGFAMKGYGLLTQTNFQKSSAGSKPTINMQAYYLLKRGGFDTFLALAQNYSTTEVEN